MKKNNSNTSKPNTNTNTIPPMEKNLNVAEAQETSSSGFIFMCSAKTKRECYMYRVFGMPKSKMDMVEKVRPGDKLFLYDFDLKLLYGVYSSISVGGLNLIPAAFGGGFPAQVSFQIDEDCIPLPESALKQAIPDNYDAKNKFNPILSQKQVSKLLSLFRPINLHPQTASQQVAEARQSAETLHMPPLTDVYRSHIAHCTLHHDPRNYPSVPVPANDPSSYVGARHAVGPSVHPAYTPSGYVSATDFVEQRRHSYVHAAYVSAPNAVESHLHTAVSANDSYAPAAYPNAIDPHLHPTAPGNDAHAVAVYGSCSNANDPHPHPIPPASASHAITAYISAQNAAEPLLCPAAPANNSRPATADISSPNSIVPHLHPAASASNSNIPSAYVSAPSTFASHRYPAASASCSYAPAAYISAPSAFDPSIYMSARPPPTDVYYPPSSSVQYYHAGGHTVQAYYSESSIPSERAAYTVVPQVIVTDPYPPPSKDYRAISGREVEYVPRADSYYYPEQTAAHAVQLTSQSNSNLIQTVYAEPVGYGGQYSSSVPGT